MQVVGEREVPCRKLMGIAVVADDHAGLQAAPFEGIDEEVVFSYRVPRAVIEEPSTQERSSRLPCEIDSNVAHRLKGRIIGGEASQLEVTNRRPFRSKANALPSRYSFLKGEEVISGLGGDQERS